MFEKLMVSKNSIHQSLDIENKGTSFERVAYRETRSEIKNDRVDNLTSFVVKEQSKRSSYGV